MRRIGFSTRKKEQLNKRIRRIIDSRIKRTTKFYNMIQNCLKKKQKNLILLAQKNKQKLQINLKKCRRT